jgi:ADP-ribose pyrophosphatase YjhB (NUDIX family)
MLSFTHPQGRFNYRVVGVVIDRRRLLVHRAEGDDFWALPGGRVEFGESAKVALARELSEELNVSAEVGRLIWVVENFFTYRDEQYHEVAFYFHVSLPDDSPLKTQDEPFTRVDNGTRLLFAWHAIDALEALPLCPAFLRRAIADMPSATQYIVHRDEAGET